MKKRENKSPSRSTKRALTSSVLALVLCFVMLLGTTFAWFTDTASTGVNTIQAGKLDIDLEVEGEDGGWVSAEGKTLKFVNEDGETLSDILWEPGCTYITEDIRVTNKGNLALKFKLEVTGLGGDAKLNEALEWGFLNGRDPAGEEMGWTTIDEELSYSPIDDEFYLLPDESVYMALIAEMKSDAGNEYQGKSIDDVAITVYATQWTYEYDSEDNQYDKYAEYAIPVSSASDLKEAIANGQDVVLTDDIELTGEKAGNDGKITASDANGKDKQVNVGEVLLVADKSMNIDLNGNTISGDAKEGILATGDITVNVYDSSDSKDGKLDITSNGGCAIYAMNGATVNVYSGTYSTKNPVAVVAQYGGIINIFGGTYESTSTDTTSVGYGLVYAPNEKSEGFTNTINVYGGTYKGFDPRNAHKKNLISVADGYKVTEANGWYTVSK